MIVAVAVSTDSTAYFPEGLAERRGTQQVPLHVRFDGRHRLDGVQLGPAERGPPCAVSFGDYLPTD